MTAHPSSLAGILNGNSRIAAMCAFLAFAAGYCLRQALRAWRDAELLDHEEKSFLNRLTSPVANQLVPKNEIEIREMRLWLQQAGWRDDAAIARYLALRLTCLLSGVGAALLLMLSVDGMGTKFAAGALCLGIGLNLPAVRLNSLRTNRQGQIERALPSLMDLMVLCLDVGLSVEAAFDRVTSEMRSLEPLMSEEAALMGKEMAAGLTFPQALKRMAERIGLEDLTTLSKLISQAALLGASIATTLREYSIAASEKRVLKLEERAGKISSLLVLPIALCMLPATLIAVAGPAIILLGGVFSTI